MKELRTLPRVRFAAIIERLCYPEADKYAKRMMKPISNLPTQVLYAVLRRSLSVPHAIRAGF
jgi:hypothetical protein